MRYGSYETIKGLATHDGKAVFLAGDKTSQGYVAKVYYIDHYAGADPKKLEKFNESFYSHVEAQKKAALGSPYIAPIIQFGQDDANAWYITKAYPSSIDKLLASKVTVDAEGLYAVLYSVVRGALDLKKICGRSHGNLLPGNILLTTPAKNIKMGQVVLTDPTAGDAAQANEIELADLRAVGELMYRLIYPHETREIDLQKVPVMPSSQRWVGLFGSHAEGWFNIFNRLLTRRLSLNEYTLEQLEADLVKLKPGPVKGAGAKVLAGAVVGIILIGSIAWFMKSGSKPPAPAPAPAPAATTPAQPAPGPATEEAKKNEAEVKAAEARRAEEEKRLAAQKTAEEKAQLEARLKTEAEATAREEARKAEETKRLLEEKRVADARAALEEQRKLQAAAQKAVEQEREKIRQEAEARRLVDERKAKELTAELERREKERVEATRKAAEAERLRKEADAKRIEEERKTRELAAELARREKEKEEAARKAAESERLRREADARRIEEERKSRELTAKLAQENQAQARQIAALRESPPAETAAAALANTPAETAPATLSKARQGERWSNSLGMKFVPQGKTLFCVWETRRKDYEEFVKTARFDVNNAWKSVSFKQEASHPVVNITAQEAMAFCKWLTERERKKGLISDTQMYRLPTDAEWSAINTRQSASALFIWGNTWPPPTGVGNFALTFSYDRFDYTAPVAQFQANQKGLFDVIGNVWEICENGRENIVACGGSWLTAAADQLNVSYRFKLNATERHEDIGFRVVLDVGD